MEVQYVIGQNIQRNREILNITIDQIADITQFSINDLTRIEEGRYPISLSDISEIALVLGIDAISILENI